MRFTHALYTLNVKKYAVYAGANAISSMTRERRLVGRLNVLYDELRVKVGVAITMVRCRNVSAVFTPRHLRLWSSSTNRHTTHGQYVTQLSFPITSRSSALSASNNMYYTNVVDNVT